MFGIFMVGFAMLTTLFIPVVFGRLSASAIVICRRMVIMMAVFTPVWVYMNAQQAIARAGGDTKMGAYTDAMITIFVMLPLLFGLGLLTDIGPVELYLCIKLINFVKVVIFHFWLKKERWLKNLTVA